MKSNTLWGYLQCYPLHKLYIYVYIYLFLIFAYYIYYLWRFDLIDNDIIKYIIVTIFLKREWGICWAPFLPGLLLWLADMDKIISQELLYLTPQYNKLWYLLIQIIDFALWYIRFVKLKLSENDVMSFNNMQLLKTVFFCIYD